MTVAELTVPVLWAGAAHLACWTVGAWVRGKILAEGSEDGDPAGRAFQSAMIGFAALGTAAVVLGAAHLLYPPLLGGLVAIAAAAGAVRILRSRPKTAWVPTLAHVPLLACVAFVVAHLPRALAPVLEHDENVYHLLLPKLYLASHALIPVPWSLFANMPHLVDLSFVFPVALGGFTAAKVFVLGFVLWTLLGLASLGRAHLGPFGPGAFAVLYLSGRLVQWHLGLAYVEPVIGALMLAAVHALSRYWDDGRIGELGVLAIVTGAACASKYTVWPVAAALFAIAAVARPKNGVRAGWRGVAMMAGLGSVALAPWLIKNVLVTGNPIFPNAYGIFGGSGWSQIQAVQLQHELGYGRGGGAGLATYLTLPFHLVADRFEPNLGASGFSAGVMVLLLASMAYPWRRAELKTALRILALAALCSFGLGSRQTRFLVAFVPVMVVTAGIALAPFRRFRVGIAAATIAIALAALLQMVIQPYPVEPLLDVFTVPRNELLSRNLCWDLTEFLNRIVPPDGRVFSFWENRLYFLDRPFATDSAHGAPSSLARLREAGDAHAFARKLAAEGVTHVVLDPRLYQTYMSDGFVFELIDEPFYTAGMLQADKALLDRFLLGELTEVPWDGGWAVFRLNAAGN